MISRKHGAGHAFLIAAVVDGEIGRIAQLADVAAEDADAERVEGRDFRPLFELLAQQGGGAFLHFVGRLVGEGDGQDSLGPNAVADQFGDAVGDDPGLSGSRPGQHQQRPGERVDGVVLGGVQVHRDRRRAGRRISHTMVSGRAGGEKRGLRACIFAGGSNHTERLLGKGSRNSVHISAHTGTPP